MKTVKINELMGGEYLASPVKTENNKIMFYEGTCIYMKHIEALVSAGIEEVEIFEQSVLSPKERKVIKENLKNDCTDRVKNVLESKITINDGFEEISKAATEIIEDVFNREEVVDHVYDIRERNTSLYDHCVTVASLSILTALKMNLSKWEVYDIGVGSLLHDMGLRFLSVNYRDKNIDEYDKDSLFEYKKHTLYGFSSVEKESWMSNESKKIILYHHERLDGEGYPFKQKVVPIGVRIVAIVDAFDDILCGIGCERGNVRKAIEYIKDGRDTYFEARIVDYFLGFIAAYPVGTYVYTNNGDEAVVIEQNEHYTDRPIICLIKNRHNEAYPSGSKIDLTENQSIYIDRVKESE